MTRLLRASPEEIGGFLTFKKKTVADGFPAHTLVLDTAHLVAGDATTGVNPSKLLPTLSVASVPGTTAVAFHTHPPRKPDDVQYDGFSGQDIYWLTEINLYSPGDRPIFAHILGTDRHIHFTRVYQPAYAELRAMILRFGAHIQEIAPGTTDEDIINLFLMGFRFLTRIYEQYTFFEVSVGGLNEIQGMTILDTLKFTPEDPFTAQMVLTAYVNNYWGRKAEDIAAAARAAGNGDEAAAADAAAVAEETFMAWFLERMTEALTAGLGDGVGDVWGRAQAIADHLRERNSAVARTVDLNRPDDNFGVFVTWSLTLQQFVELAGPHDNPTAVVGAIAVTDGGDFFTNYLPEAYDDGISVNETIVSAFSQEAAGIVN
jgi:hypothetical protein